MPKRKASTLEEAQASKQSRSNRTQQQSIYTFSSVSKPVAQANEGKKRKTVHKRAATPPPPSPAPVVKAAAIKSVAPKRKRDIVPDSDSEDEIVVVQSANLTAPAQSKPKSTPRHKRVKNAVPPTPVETPSKSAARLFDNLNIKTNARPIPIALPKKQLDYDTPPETPDEETELDFSMPSEVEDLQDLYASFLAALSMHYSHNGTSIAPQILLLLPTITKHWKKRNVTQLDLQRVLAIVPKQHRDFVLEDHGRGGIRLARLQSRGRGLKRAASYIDEEEANNVFGDALDKTWHQWQASTAKENRTAARFLDHLPLLEIIQCESTQKTSALFARGEQRLADLKAGKAAKVESKTAQAETTVQRSAQSTASRSTALLDRIIAKQNLASKLPSGPTKAELERKSALQRIEDIARVLSLMCGMKERSSFSRQAVTQQLQQSLRNPISTVEVWRCMTLMASEISPEFVKVVQSGEVQGVIVIRDGNVGLADLRARVQKACESER